jgi:hypothetical protein
VSRPSMHPCTQNSVVNVYSNDELYVRSLRDAAGVGVQRTTWLRWCRVMAFFTAYQRPPAPV